ncbi:hypothetical protein [Fibrella aquatica]|uniref:hypothetical protein n=1 Tax=Fibrella aquatica TaxID=3242487 RepID=UPI003521F30D
MLALIGLGGQEMLLIFLFFILAPIFPILPLWMIFKKSGQSPWLCLLALIPGVGVLIALCVAAYSTWRIEETE